MIRLALLGVTLAAAFGSGVWVRDSFCDAAKAKADLAAERSAHAATRIDLAAAHMSADFGNAAKQDIETREAAREERIRELEQHLATKPVGRCHLDSAGRRRLLDIYPH